jgi:hypothetical protein
VGVLSDRLDRMRVVVTVSSGEITGELRNRTDVRVWFAAGSYRRYHERDLERQLASLAKLLWAGRMKEYYAAASEAFGRAATGEPWALTPRDNRYYAARAEIVARGSSTDGRVRVAVQGMRLWTVRIADGTIRALSEEAFAACLRDAAADLIRDQLRQIQLLKDECYGRR